MKRIFAGAFALLSFAAFAAFAATTTPVQLLNPAGSTSGQAILSTGPTTAPLWGGVPLTGVTGTLAVNHGGTGASAAGGPALDNISGFASTGFIKRTGAGAYSFIADPLPIANGGTGQTSAGAALTALGGAPLASPTFTGTVTTPALTVSSGGVGVTGGLTMATGAITPVSTVGITGTPTNNNASAGAIGEYITNSTAGTSLSTATTANATSASLTAGDWDVSCTPTFAPAGSTVPSILAAGVTTTSATLPGSNVGGYVQLASSFPAGAAQVVVTPTVRISLSSTTTTYCVVQSTFTVSTMTVNGFIRARRVR
jgi:hypothetical protein